MSADDALIVRQQHALMQLNFESSLPASFPAGALYVSLSPDDADVQSGLLRLVEALYYKQEDLFETHLILIKPTQLYLRTGEKLNPQLIVNGILNVLNQLPTYHASIVLDDVSNWDKPEWVPLLETLLSHGQQTCQFVLVCRETCNHLPLQTWREKGLLGDHQPHSEPEPLEHFEQEHNGNIEELYEMAASTDIEEKEKWALYQGRSMNYVLEGRGHDVLQFFASIPFKYFLERPRLGMAWLWTQALTLRVSERIQEVMDAVHQHIQTRQNEAIDMNAEDVQLAAQFQLFVANVFGSGPQSDDYLALCEESIAALDPHDEENYTNEELICFGRFNLGLALLAKDLKAARPHLESSKNVADAFRNLFQQISRESSRAIAEIDVQTDNWDQALESLKNVRVARFCNYVPDYGLKITELDVHLSYRSIYTGICVAAEAVLRYNRNDTAKAREIAEHAFDNGKSMGHGETMIENLIPLAMIEAQKHNYLAAQEQLALASELAESCGLIHIQAALGAHMARLHMRMAMHSKELGPLEAVAAWVRQTRIADDWNKPRLYVPIMLHDPEYEALTYARYLLLTGHHTKVRQIAEWAIQQCFDRGAGFPRYECEVLLSLTSTEPAQAKTYMQQAVQRVKQQNAPRLLHDFGAVLGNQIEELIGETDDPWIQELIAGFAEDKHAFPAPSPQEHQILQLMSQGMKHEEIAQKRAEALDATMEHINHLYQMLDVKQRSDCLTKARRFGWV